MSAQQASRVLPQPVLDVPQSPPEPNAAKLAAPEPAQPRNRIGSERDTLPGTGAPRVRIGSLGDGDPSQRITRPDTASARARCTPAPLEPAASRPSLVAEGDAGWQAAWLAMAVFVVVAVVAVLLT